MFAGIEGAAEGGGVSAPEGDLRSFRLRWFLAWFPYPLILYFIVNAGGYFSFLLRGVQFDCGFRISVSPVGDMMMACCDLLVGGSRWVAWPALAVLPYALFLVIPRHPRLLRWAPRALLLALLSILLVMQASILLLFHSGSAPIFTAEHPGMYQFVLRQSWELHRSYPKNSEEIRWPWQEIRLLTYNVWENPFRTSERLPGLFKEVLESKADLIALQEVTPWFLEALRAQPWIQNYQEIQEGEFLLLCSKAKFSSQGEVLVPLPGRLGRKALVCTLRHLPTARTLGGGVVHLESFLEDGAVRAAQLDLLFPQLAQADDAVLMGDFNFGDGEPETSHLDPSYKDARLAYPWEEPGDTYTWDIERNALAKRGSFPGEGSRRLDRILCRSSRWVPRSVYRVGVHPVTSTTDLWPSDHFGVAAKFWEK